MSLHISRTVKEADDGPLHSRARQHSPIVDRIVDIAMLPRRARLAAAELQPTPKTNFIHGPSLPLIWCFGFDIVILGSLVRRWG